MDIFREKQRSGFSQFSSSLGLFSPRQGEGNVANDDDKVPGSEEKSNFSGRENLGGGKYSNDPDLMLNALRFLPFNIFPSKPN